MHASLINAVFLVVLFDLWTLSSSSFLAVAPFAFGSPCRTGTTIPALAGCLSMTTTPLTTPLQVWFDGRPEKEEKSATPPLDLLEKLEESPDALIVSNAQHMDKGGDTTTSNLPFRSINADNNRLMDEKDKIVGIVIEISNAKQQQDAMAAMGSVEWILVQQGKTEDGWKMIPAENLIVAAQSTGTQLAFCVQNAFDVGGLARALEFGVDALCVPANAPASVWDAVFWARAPRGGSIA